MDLFFDDVLADLASIRSRSPVVLNVTNLVAMDLTANALLAVGASPIMAHAPEELPELIALCDAVVVNIGTLDTRWMESAVQAAELAGRAGKPVVLDPVGAGATRFRTQAVRQILGTGAIAVLRGNASEIAAVFEEVGGTRGVDSVLSPENVAEVAKRFCSQSDLVVVASGETDHVFQRQLLAKVHSGCAVMSKVTAMGCTATSLIGAFLGVNSSAFRAALNATSVMAVCGEIAGDETAMPGSFRVAFLDRLAGLDARAIRRLRVTLP